MNKELQEVVDAMTGKLRVKLVPKSTPTDKYVEKLIAKNPLEVAATLSVAWQRPKPDRRQCAALAAPVDGLMRRRVLRPQRPQDQSEVQR
jgi:hypothetical protein